METTCKNCLVSYQKLTKFCTQCGTALHETKNEKKTKALNLIIAFYVAFLVFAVIMYFIGDEYYESLAAEITIESIFALLVIGFSVLDYKNILKLYTIPILNWKVWIFAFIFPIFTAFTVHFFVEFINSYVFEIDSLSYYVTYLYLDYPLFWAILFITILPPVFEELAFRGFLFNKLNEVSSNNVTIIGTAFIFALVHFSIISFLWIFPFGIILGYLRSKYKTLWIGMIIHFIHNFIVLMIDYFNYLNV